MKWMKSANNSVRFSVVPSIAMAEAPHVASMQRYLDAFSAGDVSGVLALFADGARVYSPSQTEAKSPQDFFPPVLARSTGTVFAMKATFVGTAPGSAAVHFDYRKPMADGSVRVFDCVDIFTFDSAGKIVDMRILFDTKNLQP